MPATVVSFDEGSRSYRVLLMGVEVGPVWSVSGVRQSIGAAVEVVVSGSRLLELLP